MKKIAIIINSLGSGGAERVVVNLSEYLILQGYDVALITLRDPSNDFYRINPSVKRLDIHNTSIKSGLINTIFRMRRLLKKEAPDYVLGMMTVPSIITILSSIGLPTKAVISERNHPPKKYTPFRWRILRWLLYRFSYSSVVLTSQTAIWMSSIGCKHINVIPVSVDLPLLDLNPEVPPSKYIRDADFVFLAVGRLHHQKGFDLLLVAFSKITVQASNAKLIILGEGEERSLLEAQIYKLGLGNKVIMPGRVGNISAWYKRANVFILSSRFEGFGNVLVEAMASGCACLSFDCDTGPRDVIKNNFNGILVESNNVEELSQQMVKLYMDVKLRNYLAINAKQIANIYSGKYVLSKWLEVFK